MTLPANIEPVLTTPIFAVSLRPVGSIKEFATVHHPGAVAMVAHDDEFVYLTRQYRPAIGREAIELPAGTREPEEDPVETARRELREEIGMDARSLNLLYGFYSSPGYTDEFVLLFRAWDLYVVDPEPGDPDEAITVMKLPLDNLDYTLTGQQSEAALTAKTIIGLTMLKEELRL